MSPADPTNWNQKIIEEFHSNAGKVGGYFEGAHMILIHHIGARSGRERVNPLNYLPDGDDMIIAATKAELRPTPTGTTTSNEIPGSRSSSEPRPLQSMRQRSREKSANELWRRLVDLRPGLATYETKTSRVFPMFRLTCLS